MIAHGFRSSCEAIGLARRFLWVSARREARILERGEKLSACWSDPTEPIEEEPDSITQTETATGVQEIVRG